MRPFLGGASSSYTHTRGPSVATTPGATRENIQRVVVVSLEQLALVLLDRDSLHWWVPGDVESNLDTVPFLADLVGSMEVHLMLLDKVHYNLLVHFDLWMDPGIEHQMLLDMMGVH